MSVSAEPCSPAAPAGDPPRFGRVAVVVLLVIHGLLLAWGAATKSPTLNEPGHLVAGISYWTFNRFDVYSVNPPLVRLVAALPVMAAGCETNWKSFTSGPGARPEMAMGQDFCHANGRRTFFLVTLARLACIPFALLGGWYVHRWSRELYGDTGAIVSLAVWCFSPLMLAHGQLITSDAAATALGLAACHGFWRWLKIPTWQGAAVSGALLGLAELAKTTLLVFLPLWPLLWIAFRFPEWRSMTARQWGREAGMLVLRIAIAFYVINFGYAFEDPLPRLGSFTFVSKSLSGLEGDAAQRGGNRFADTLLADLPLPLPRNYVVGIDLQRRDFETYHHEFFLAGRWSKTGWWYYYLAFLAMKVPLGTWLLLLVAATARGWQRPATRLRDEMVLLVPPLAILAFVSAQTGMNEHGRYVLPILPFFQVWIGRLGPTLDAAFRKGPSAPVSIRAAALLTGAGLAWGITSSLCCVPHSLAYFNETVGGRWNGWRYLLSSNVDWGQDLLALDHFIATHPDAKGLTLAYYGGLEPAKVGIDCVAMRPDDADRLLALADWDAPGNGWNYFAFGATPAAGYNPAIVPPALVARLATTEPFARIGDAMMVFRVAKPALSEPATAAEPTGPSHSE